LILVWTLSLVPSPLLAQSAGVGERPDGASLAKEARLSAMKRMASRYDISMGINGELKLERTAEPVLRWTNPVRGHLDGCLYLWTHAGQPQAVLSMYPTLDE